MAYDAKNDPDNIYINPQVAKMFGIPYSQLTDAQKKILGADSKRRARLIEKRQNAVLQDNLKAFEDEAKMEKLLASIYKECQKEILADVSETIAKVQRDGGTWSYANQSALTRSRGLFQQIEEELVKLGSKENLIFTQGLEHIFTDQFLRTTYSLGQVINVQANFNKLNPAYVRATLNYPWSGAMFSDRLWNDKQTLGRNLRIGLTQSMILGENMHQITQRINKNLNTSESNAMRVARTETKRVTYCAHEEVLKDCGVKRVELMCASGACGVCLGVEKEYEFDDPDKPNLPIHPNCRCWYRPIVSDTFEDNELNELTGSIRGAENYEKWVEAQKEKTPVIDTPKATVKDVTTQANTDDEVVKGISEIRKRTTLAGTVTEADLQEAGNLMIEHLKKSDTVAQVTLQDTRVKELKALKDSKYSELSKIMWDPNRDEALYTKLRSEYSDLHSSYLDEHLKLIKLKQDTSESTLMSLLGKIRDIGYTDDKYITTHLGHKTTKVTSIQKLSIMRAYKGYPTDWIANSVNTGNLTIKTVKRGYYSKWKAEIAISGKTMEDCLHTAYHELGHRFEDTVKGILEAEKVFYDRRTKGEDLKWLGSGYSRDEKARKDHFIDAYMGKDYGGDAYELVSMGFQYAYTDALRLWEDPDFATFIYGLLCLV